MQPKRGISITWAFGNSEKWRAFKAKYRFDAGRSGGWGYYLGLWIKVCSRSAFITVVDVSKRYLQDVYCCDKESLPVRPHGPGHHGL